MPYRAGSMSESVLWSTIEALWPIGLVVLIAALLERFRPWRYWTIDRLRWLHASILFIFGTVLTHIVLPVGHAGIAFLAYDKGWGLLNLVPVPAWLAVAIGVLVLDLTQWICHWSMHRLPFLWRIHRLHHSDEVVDFSTGFRFHPAETVGRFLLQACVIATLGVPVAAIAITAILIIVFDVFGHANIRFPGALRRITGIVITPDLHRIHHSSDLRQQNSNFGVIFSIWDRMFGTFVSDRELTDAVEFGLGPQNRLGFGRLADLLTDPFRRD